MSQTKSKRCAVCNKKVGLDGYECKCNKDKLYCPTHRYPFAHNCSIDTHLQHKQLLLQTNPKVTANKVASI